MHKFFLFSCTLQQTHETVITDFQCSSSERQNICSIRKLQLHRTIPFNATPFTQFSNQTVLLTASS